ncbi:AraC family transcriptional regulator [Paenibacillus sp. N1-5-1-14]|uniref:helix-turn-helix domain-containing protein n=1 Tax=Paenibacillus radicibacter TaxID=2972488 RepID=UPI002158E4E5|nr:AraC family transcriptional regulator [Paenibacillus radicibacter]MCR8642937.1 AraC family transcriptional regulator [Paenibacillus radicibacter]
MYLSKIWLPNSKVGYYHLEAHHADEYHGHGDCYQVSIPIFGTPILNLNNRNNRLIPKDTFITPPSDQHQNFAGDESARFLLITIEEKFLSKVLEETVNFTDQVHFANWNTGIFDRLIKFAENLYLRMADSLCPVTLTEMEYLELQIVHQLFNDYPGSHSDKWIRKKPKLISPELKQVVKYIQTEYTNELCLDNLCEISGMGKTKLIRSFTGVLGVTPWQYIREMRLRRAEHLLLTSTDDITKIAFESGYGSLSSFERSFRNRYNMSADTYRKGKKEN